VARPVAPPQGVSSFLCTQILPARPGPARPGPARDFTVGPQRPSDAWDVTESRRSSWTEILQSDRYRACKEAGIGPVK
jgi:hypothetical protein